MWGKEVSGGMVLLDSIRVLAPEHHTRGPRRFVTLVKRCYFRFQGVMAHLGIIPVGHINP